MISTPNAPVAIGPYAQARIAGSLLFVSGQLPLDPKTGAITAQCAEGQMKQCLANISAIAEAANTNLSRCVKTSIFLTNLSDFASVNSAYGAVFTEPFPARSTFQVVALPKGALVEVEAVIALEEKR